MARFKDWTITLKLTESIAGEDNPHGDREMENRVRRELNAHIPATSVEAVKIVDSTEYYA